MNILGTGLGCVLQIVVYGLCTLLVLYGFFTFFVTGNIWWLIGPILLAAFVFGVGVVSAKY